MAKQERYLIGPSLLSDIRQTITRVDSIAPRTSGASHPVRLQELQRPAPSTLRRGTFTGSWAIGETASVEIQGTTQTIEVTNYCVPVEVGTASTQAFNVVFGSVMGTQTAVEIEHTPLLLRGTFSGPWGIGESKEITVESTGDTYTVKNYCVPVDEEGEQSLNVIFGPVLGEHAVLEIERTTSTCTLIIGGIDLRELPDYDATVIQLLGHGESSEGSSECGLKWFSVTACSTATAT